ncbi:MAG: nuclear transport factor 2 family protein [Thermoleophilia bacterium]
MAGDRQVLDREAETVALDFVDRINRHDIDTLVQAMTDDHEFIDTAVGSIVGRDAMRDAWNAYYRLFPDYHIDVERVSRHGDLIVLLGRSTGTLSPAGRRELAGPDGVVPPDDELQGPAIWTGLVRNGLVSQWRVYVDDDDARAALGIG